MLLEKFTDSDPIFDDYFSILLLISALIDQTAFSSL